MSAIKKTAKATLYIFSFFVLLFVAAGAYIYVNMDSLAKQLSEKIASDTLGVPVTIGNIKISLEDKKVTVNNIEIANPGGYKKPNAIEINSIIIAAQSLSKELLNFARVNVNGTHVNLEVSGKGTNLGDLKKNMVAQKAKKEPKKNDKKIKIIVQKFSLTQAQLNPSVTLLKKDLAYINVPDIHLTGIGEKQGGIVAQEALQQIMDAVLKKFNASANSAGFLEGLSLDTLNKIGITTGEVFQKNLKKSFDKDVQQFKEGVDGLKGLFKKK